MVSLQMEPTMISLKVLSTAAAIALVLPIAAPGESFAQGKDVKGHVAVGGGGGGPVARFSGGGGAPVARFSGGASAGPVARLSSAGAGTTVTRYSSGYGGGWYGGHRYRRGGGFF